MKLARDRSIYKTAAALIIVVGILAYLLVAAVAIAISRKEVIRCSQFTTQPAAQATFDSDPEKYAALDGDKDNKVCVNLPKN